ncbi:MAG TPA: ATP-binding cassette domain-containing protein [Rhodanobacter sp.]|uniref:ABC transporter ATP-binding protein n=1 Tax=Rhodanobacter sp. FW021-MT20 TaxID=1162282 RepID=UPI002B57EBEA|nr:ATP-binding cassette domain-containing protein [Rhodanobacter sp.]
MHFTVNDVSKSFGGRPALDRVSFAVGERDFVCLLGPSGCGKTTLLRIVAGLLATDSGSIMLGARDITRMPARERNFGIVFQSYSLFPNMTVAENIGYGMKLRGLPPRAAAARRDELLRLIQLPDEAGKYPAQLSGGQQQRVALARALAVDPALLLLDEPLSALDARVREQMRGEIHQVQRQLGIPTLMVTHDQQEALTLADTIICMNRGRIEQIGTPRQLYMNPATRFVAQFIGASNLLPTSWVREALPTLLSGRPAAPDHHLEACLRPEDVHATAAEDGEGTVRAVTFLGSMIRLVIDWRGRSFTAEQHRDCTLKPGDSVTLDVRPDRCAWVAA